MTDEIPEGGGNGGSSSMLDTGGGGGTFFAGVDYGATGVPAVVVKKAGAMLSIPSFEAARMDLTPFYNALCNDMALYFSPWLGVDQPRWPAEFVLFPRLKKFELWQAEWRARIRFCRDVLRWGIPPERDEW